MSSEESSVEDNEALNIVKVLPWRADIVGEFLNDLDAQYSSKKSSQAKRQTKRRVSSTTLSTRPVPAGLPNWARAN